MLFDWPGRAALYDNWVEHEKNDIHELYMRTGLAAPYARVQFLKEEFASLEDEKEDRDETGRRHNVWLAEPKVIPSPDGGVQVYDTYRYNAPLLTHIFQILDDIAKETNGRRMSDRSEELLQALILKVGTDKLPGNTLARIASGENAFEVLLSAINALSVESPALPTIGE